MPQSTIKASQEIQFTIPALPKQIMTTAGAIALEDLSSETIRDIFETMKENALEMCKDRKKTNGEDLKKK